MKVNCLYRLTKNGTIIQSTYDTEVGSIEGLSTDYFYYLLDSSKWNPELYTKFEPYSIEKMEQFLITHPDASVTIEINGSGFYAFTREFIGLFVGDVWDTWTTVFALEEPIFANIPFLELGFAVVKVRQFEEFVPYPALMFNKATREIHLPSGNYPIGFPGSEVIRDNKGIEEYYTKAVLDYPGCVGCTNTVNGVKFLIIKDGVVEYYER